MTDIVDISAKIVTELSDITGLHSVYAYEPALSDDGKYPFATVTIDSVDGQFGDTQRNVRTYKFVVRVYQERTKVGNSKAERLIREIADEILTLFDNNTTLDGMVKMVRPVTANFDYIDREIGDTRVAEYNFECVNVVPSIT